MSECILLVDVTSNIKGSGYWLAHEGSNFCSKYIGSIVVQQGHIHKEEVITRSTVYSLRWCWLWR